MKSIPKDLGQITGLQCVRSSLHGLTVFVRLIEPRRSALGSRSSRIALKSVLQPALPARAGL